MRTVAQILYEVHEEKKRELYSMPAAGILICWLYLG